MTCKNHTWRETPMTARNGRKYQKCTACNKVTFVKGYEMVLPPLHEKSAPVVQVSMVSKSYGVPHENGTEFYPRKASRRKKKEVEYIGIWS